MYDLKPTKNYFLREGEMYVCRFVFVYVCVCMNVYRAG